MAQIKIGIIGGGNMGAAIFNSLKGNFRVSVCEKDKNRCQYLKNLNAKILDIKELVQQADTIIIAVKPQDMETLLREVSLFLTKEKLLISIAAGITTAFIEKRVKKYPRVIRTMPNMPAQVQEGITAICLGKFAKKSDGEMARKIFNQLGKTVIVKEELLDAITAVSGSGPAYVFLFVECLIRAAQSLGLGPALSQTLVESTLLGSAHLLNKLKEDPAKLRAKVTSKGGTTQAAMDIFFEHRIDQIFIEALSAAKNRAKELSKD